jgi:hypothetical protein
MEAFQAMNIRRLSAWAIIFSGLLIYVLVVEKPALKIQPPAQRGDYEKLFDLAQSDIESVSITCEGKRVTLGRKNLTWQVTGPPGAEALPEQCESMVSSVLDTVVLSVVEENPVQLAQYGLDAPELTIAVNAGNLSTLKLGKKSPSGVSMYGLDEERKRVVLVGTYLNFSAKMFIGNIKNLPEK